MPRHPPTKENARELGWLPCGEWNAQRREKRQQMSTDSSFSPDCKHCRSSARSRSRAHSSHRVHHASSSSRHTIPFVYAPGAPLGAPSAPHGTGVVVPGWAEAAIAALKAENRHLRHELRAARVEAKENKQLRREELRLTVSVRPVCTGDCRVWLSCFCVLGKICVATPYVHWMHVRRALVSTRPTYPPELGIGHKVGHDNVAAAGGGADRTVRSEGGGCADAGWTFWLLSAQRLQSSPNRDQRMGHAPWSALLPPWHPLHSQWILCTILRGGGVGGGG